MGRLKVDYHRADATILYLVTEIFADFITSQTVQLNKGESI